jgi:broad specificity phosphatase PhoE
MRALFMRHGQTNYNLLQLCNDNPADPVFLTDTGKQQAAQAGERLRHEPVEQIYISPLPRTRETAEIVNRHFHAPITVHPALLDIRSGCNGKPVSDYHAAIGHDLLHARAGDGESLIEHKQRVNGFLDWLASQPHRCVLVVAHEETLRVVIARYRRLPDEAMPPLRIDNAEVLAFDI